MDKERAKKDLKKLKKTTKTMKNEYNQKRISDGIKNSKASSKVKAKKTRFKKDMKKCAEALNDIMEEPDTPQQLPKPI